MLALFNIRGGFGILFILLTVFWIWMLVDCIKNEGLTGNERIVWILVVIFLGWLGALIYMLAARDKQSAGPTAPPGS